MEKWVELLTSGEPVEMRPAETRRRSISLVLCSASAAARRFGKIVRWYGTNTDIDELKRVNRLLSAEKRPLEMITSGASLTEILEACAMPSIPEF